MTEHLAVASARVSAEVAHLKGKLESLDTVAGRVTRRAKHVFREVLGIDRLRAHQVDRRAETVMRLKANHAVVDADGVVKVDGKQVQLG